jgi:hypothetical protein
MHECYDKELQTNNTELLEKSICILMGSGMVHAWKIIIDNRQKKSLFLNDLTIPGTAFHSVKFSFVLSEY